MNSLSAKYSIKSGLPLLLVVIAALGIGALLYINIKVGLLFFVVLLFIGPIIFFPLTFYLVFIATLPLEGFAAFQDFSFTKIFGLIVLISLLLKILITREFIRLRDPFYLFFYLFLVTSMISTLMAADPIESLRFLSTYFFLGMLYFITCYFINSIKIFDTIFVLLIFATILISVLVQVMGLSIRHIDTWRMSSGFGDPNEFALFLVVMLPLAFYKIVWSAKSTKPLYLVAFSALLMLLMFTGSRGGILAFGGLMLVLTFYFIRKRGHYLILLPVLIAILLQFLTPEDFWERLVMLNYFDRSNSMSSEIRLSFYQAALRMFVDHPIFGVGLHNFRFLAVEYGAGKAMVTHNTYLEILTGGGIINFIPFVLMLGLAWKRLAIKQYSDPRLRDLAACLKASLVAFMMGAIFITADHKKYLWLLLAFISAVYFLSRVRFPSLSRPTAFEPTPTTFFNQNRLN